MKTPVTVAILVVLVSCTVAEQEIDQGVKGVDPALDDTENTEKAQNDESKAVNSQDAGRTGQYQLHEPPDYDYNPYQQQGAVPVQDPSYDSRQGGYDPYNGPQGAKEKYGPVIGGSNPTGSYRVYEQPTSPSGSYETDPPHYIDPYASTAQSQYGQTTQTKGLNVAYLKKTNQDPVDQPPGAEASNKQNYGGYPDYERYPDYDRGGYRDYEQRDYEQAPDYRGGGNYDQYPDYRGGGGGGGGGGGYEPLPDYRPDDRAREYETDYRGEEDGYDPYASNGYSSGPNSAVVYGDEASNNIQAVETICDSRFYNKMVVNIKFTGGFSGRIYPKGYFNVRQCSSYGDGSYLATVELPLDGCGTQEYGGDYEDHQQEFVTYENVIIIMNEASLGVLEEWDRAYRVSCIFDKKAERRVDYGITVPMLRINDAKPYRAPIPDVFLKVVKGYDPRAAPASELYVGTHAALIITLADNHYWDVFVSYCFAHDGVREDRIMLIDEKGCPANPKLLKGTHVARDQPEPGKNAFIAQFKAFKFPDRPNVYFQCTVHICFRYCKPTECYAPPGHDEPQYHGRAKRETELVLNPVIEHSSGETALSEGDLGNEVNLYRGIIVRIPGDPSWSRSEQVVGVATGCISKAKLGFGITVMSLSIGIALIIAIYYYAKIRSRRRSKDRDLDNEEDSISLPSRKESTRK